MSRSWNVIQVPSLTLDNGPSLFCRKGALVPPTWIAHRVLHIGKAASSGIPPCAVLCTKTRTCAWLSPQPLLPLPKQRPHILPLVCQAVSCRAGYAHMLDSQIGNPGLYVSSSFCQPCALGQDGSISWVSVSISVKWMVITLSVKILRKISKALAWGSKHDNKPAKGQ